MSKQGGYVTLTVALLVFLLGAFYVLAPKKPASEAGTQTAEKCIQSGAGGEVIPYNGGNYKQIRAQVQIESKLFTDRSYSNLVESNHNRAKRVFDVYAPTSTVKTVNRLKSPQFSQTENQLTEKFYLIDSGLVFFVHKEEATLQPKVLKVSGIEFWKTDVYQDVTKLSSKPVPSEIFYCLDSNGNTPSPSPTPEIRVYQPTNQVGQQIQLESFDFTKNPGYFDDPTLALIEGPLGPVPLTSAKDECEDSFSTTQPSIPLPAFSGATGIDTSQTVNYRRIRKDIPLLQWFFPGFSAGAADQAVMHGIAYNSVVVEGATYQVYYPDVNAQLDIFEADGTRRRDYLAWTEGLVILVQPSKLANPQPGNLILYGNKYGRNPMFVRADVYQDVTKQLPNYTLTCNFPPNNPATAGTVTLFEPAQDKSGDKKQLQLQHFLFAEGISGWTMHCKPAIYLYPKNKSLVNVKVNTKGFLSYVDPPYNQKTGWTVTAYPDGRLVTLNSQTYPYLYYESKVPDDLIDKPQTGWVVRFEELETLYKEVLPKLGLDKIQTRDFIEYWKKGLPHSPYYFVGVVSQENLDFIEPLEITPKPDQIERVRIYFEALDKPRMVIAPHLPTTNNQLLTTNFSVVEWGGMIKRDKNHPFTCSQ